MLKMILLITLITGLYAVDFTSFKNKKFTPLVSQDSPGALNNLYDNHKWVQPTHKQEINDLNKSKNILVAIYVENKNIIFECTRLNKLLLNYVKIKYERVK